MIGWCCGPAVLIPFWIGLPRCPGAIWRQASSRTVSAVGQGCKAKGSAMGGGPQVHLAAKLSRLSMRSVPSDSGSDGERNDRSVTDLREAGAVSAREAHGMARRKGG